MKSAILAVGCKHREDRGRDEKPSMCQLKVSHPSSAIQHLPLLSCETSKNKARKRALALAKLLPRNSLSMSCSRSQVHGGPSTSCVARRRAALLRARCSKRREARLLLLGPVPERREVWTRSSLAAAERLQAQKRDTAGKPPLLRSQRQQTTSL